MGGMLYNFRNCYKCTDRQVGCHATCERYKTEKVEHDKAVQQYKDSINPVINEGAWTGDSGFRKRHKHHKY